MNNTIKPFNKRLNRYTKSAIDKFSRLNITKYLAAKQQEINASISSMEMLDNLPNFDNYSFNQEATRKMNEIYEKEVAHALSSHKYILFSKIPRTIPDEIINVIFEFRVREGNFIFIDRRSISGDLTTAMPKTSQASKQDNDINTTRINNENITLSSTNFSRNDHIVLVEDDFANAFSRDTVKFVIDQEKQEQDSGVTHSVYKFMFNITNEMKTRSASFIITPIWRNEDDSNIKDEIDQLDFCWQVEPRKGIFYLNSIKRTLGNHPSTGNLTLKARFKNDPTKKITFSVACLFVNDE